MRYTDYVMLTYQQATTGPDRNKWKQAIAKEKQFIEKNKVQHVVDATSINGRKTLTSKWILMTKWIKLKKIAPTRPDQ